jgi:hypothetical protein
MRFMHAFCVFALSFGAVFCAACVVNAETVSFAKNPLWLSSTRVTEGKTVQISTVVMKADVESAQGTVFFLANGKEIGSADFSLSESVGGAVVAVGWAAEKGSHAVSAKISAVKVVRNGKEETLPASGEIKSAEALTVDADNDRDGVSDANDADDDNDGISDSEETKNGTDPFKKEVTPTVAGMSTTSVSGIVKEAKDIAGPIGETVLSTTEGWREKGKEFFEGKVAGASNTQGFASTTNADIKNNPMGIFEMVKHYVYKGGSFVFGNVYAFYLIGIGFILLGIRKIWRRYSMD